MNKTLPLSRSLVIAGSVAVGIASAWFMLASWLEGVVQSAMQNREAFENVYTTVTGEPVLVRTTNRSMQTTDKILSLSGEPVKLTSQDLLYAQTLPGPETRVKRLNTLSWQNRMVAANDGGVPPMYWYLVHDGENPGRAYGVGYHASTQTIVGYFGRSGFGDTLPPRDEWFEIPGQASLQTVSTMRFYGQEPRWTGADRRPLLLADGKLWKIDLVKREIIKLLDCPEGYRLGWAWRILEKLPQLSGSAEQLSAASITPLDGLVREPESLLVVEPKSGESKRYPLPAEFRKHSIAAAQLPDGNLLLITQRSYEDAEGHIVWLKPNGEIAKQQTIRRKLQWQGWSLTAMGWWWAFDAPLPLVNAAVTLGWMPNMATDSGGDEEADDDYWRAVGTVLGRTWPSILVVFAAACVVAWLAYRRQKRFGLPNPAAWAVFAFIFGLPGWIAYRFHRVWPVLEECPACRQPSPRDREECLDCGKAFPRPAMKGIEVFA